MGIAPNFGRAPEERDTNLAFFRPYGALTTLHSKPTAYAVGSGAFAPTGLYRNRPPTHRLLENTAGPSLYGYDWRWAAGPADGGVSHGRPVALRVRLAWGCRSGGRWCVARQVARPPSRKSRARRRRLSRSHVSFAEVLDASPDRLVEARGHESPRALPDHRRHELDRRCDLRDGQRLPRDRETCQPLIPGSRPGLCPSPGPAPVVQLPHPDRHGFSMSADYRRTAKSASASGSRWRFALEYSREPSVAGSRFEFRPA